MVVEAGVRARMRDGVSLVADVYRPAGPGRYPVLLSRTPYNRRVEGAVASRLAAAGYVVAVQDVRGRFGSEGVFEPFLNEVADGFDSVEWAAGLPGSTGAVGMFGGSSVDLTQLFAAAARPPHLRAKQGRDPAAVPAHA